MTKNTTEDIFQEDNKANASWFKFEKIGDSISGKLVTKSEQEGTGNYPAQKVYGLKLEDGSVMNVGISVNKSYVVDRAEQAELGDTLGFKFEKEVKSKTKGNANAKSIEVYIVKGESVEEDTGEF